LILKNKLYVSSTDGTSVAYANQTHIGQRVCHIQKNHIHILQPRFRSSTWSCSNKIHDGDVLLVSNMKSILMWFMKGVRIEIVLEELQMIFETCSTIVWEV